MCEEDCPIQEYFTYDIQHDLAMGLASERGLDEPLNRQFYNELCRRGAQVPTQCEYVHDIYARDGKRLVFVLKDPPEKPLWDLFRAVDTYLDKLMPLDYCDPVRGQQMKPLGWGYVQDLMDAVHGVDPSWVDPIQRNFEKVSRETHVQDD